MRPSSLRPTTWEGIVGQDVAAVRERVDPDPDKGSHFFFHGPPGTGKTTVAYMIGRQLHGSTGELMEFNSSDDRGVDVVRDSIGPAANQTTLTGLPRVVFLDEMDSMTQEAQQALRKPLENARGTFVLACNDPTAVHDAIKSRCYCHEFQPVPQMAIIERLRHLNDQEDLGLDDGQIGRIAAAANGDMRKAIHHLDHPPAPEPDGGTEGQAFEQAAHEYAHDGG